MLLISINKIYRISRTQKWNQKPLKDRDRKGGLAEHPSTNQNRAIN